ncbi:MAG: glycosyltransferase family 39 protein, partial [Chloroflexota bacterium]
RQFQLYQLYPQLMSMTYAFVYQAAEWHNPYPARLMTALLNLTGLSATFLLARQVHSTTAAWIAVLLLALTPDFGTWASAGYVDLPMAAYYTLCAVFTWAALHHGRTTDVALAALMIGLAAWVKNAALLGCLLFFTILLWGLIRRKLALKQVLLASGLVAIVALPWYARNLILSGQLIPDTVWADDAQQTLSEIFVLVTRPQNYGLPGVVMLISVWWGGWQLLRTQHSGVFFVLWWSVPYYVLWLFFASYDPRFILLFLPFLSILGAMLCATLWQQAGNRRQPILAVMMVLVTVLAVQVMWGSVEFKRDILQNPLMSHEEKLDIVNRE